MQAPTHLAPSLCPICRKGAQFTFIENYSSSMAQWSLYECHSCCIQFWLPLMVPSGETYDEVAYEGKGEILNKENARTIVDGYWNVRKFLHGSLAKNAGGKKLLDVGCGTGEFMFVAQEIGYDVEGIDFNKNAIAFAKQRFGLDKAHVSDIYEFLKKKTGEYDVVTIFEVIEHVPDPAALLAHARATLKPGGFLVLSTPNRERYWDHIDKQTESWDFPYQHLSRWSASALKAFVTAAGFSTVALKEELPVDWFVAKLRTAASIFSKKSSPDDRRTISEKVRGGLGFSRYHRIKKIITAICAIPSWVMFHVFCFKGVHMYGVFRKP